MKRALALWLALSGNAYAFSTGNNFDMDPLTSDGAGGIAFDGAPRFTLHTCEVCHTNAPHLVGLKLESDDASVFSDGWQANKQYHMRVLLQNEHAGAQYASLGDNCGFAAATYVPCDNNGFALEIDDAQGNPQGSYVPVVNNACANSGTIPPDVDIRVLTDKTAITHNGAHAAQTGWDFCWTAPGSGTGGLTVYMATVDGNGGDGTMNFPADTIGDDVAVGQVGIQESGAAPPPPQTGGCSAGGDASVGVALVLLVLLRGRRKLAALLALSTLGGCVHVRPRERETLAKRSMKFSPDPLEDELDLHMQESREGAAGGYGSSGGGCGCN